MKHMILFIHLLLSLTTFLSAEPKANASGHFVTYGFSGGRFGDQMVSFMHAKWFAYKYRMTLLYKPFDYSDQLVLSKEEVAYNPLKKKWGNIEIKTGQEFDRYYPTTVLFTIPYFPLTIYEHKMIKSKVPFLEVNWKDPAFKAELQRVVKPLKPLNTVELPTDRITVALHVRKGSGSDNASTYKVFPLKMPPDQYYIEQLQKLYDLVEGRPLYVHLFTDHPNPYELAALYYHAMGSPENVWMEYNTEKKSDLDDYFSIPQFDCLIRPQSNFSSTAAKLGNYMIEIEPRTYHFNGKQLIIDDVGVMLSPDWQERIQNY